MSGIGKSAMREELENCRKKVTNMISHYLREDKGKSRMDNWNRNHADNYKMLNRVARRVLPLNNAQTGRLESQVYFHDALKEYLSIMENRYMTVFTGKK